MIIKNYLSDYKNQILDNLDTHKGNFGFTEIRISSNNSRYSQVVKEQTPGGLGIVGNSKFGGMFFPDFDLVINKPNLSLKYNFSRSILLHIEPPSYISLLGLSNKKLTDKFRLIFTSDPYLLDLGDERIVASSPYVHWHLSSNVYTGEIRSKQEIVDFDFLLNSHIPVKSENLVLINSNLRTLSGHIIRANFIEKLCESSIKFKLYGGSYWSKFSQYIDNAPNGKWPVFSKSRFVLVIENECAEYYWSEKFTDAILSFAIPIYYGCPNISEYFPEGSYYPININAPNVFDEIKTLIESDYYEKNIANLLKARDLVLHKLNLFSFIDRQISGLI